LRQQDKGSPPDDVNRHGGNDGSRAYCAQVPVVYLEDRFHGPALLHICDGCTLNGHTRFALSNAPKCALLLSGAIILAGAHFGDDSEICRPVAQAGVPSARVGAFPESFLGRSCGRSAFRLPSPPFFRKSALQIAHILDTIASHWLAILTGLRDRAHVPPSQRTTARRSQGEGYLRTSTSFQSL
jgi:hypothetical protein